MARKAWHQVSGSDAVRLVTPERSLSASARHRHARVAPSLLECLAYPLTDGPGVGLLGFFPPILTFLTLPIFDVIAILEPLSRGDWALGLLVFPIFGPLMVIFSLVFGYVLLFLGQLFVASALGEAEHPSWPEWDPPQISEGLGRWIWAALLGLAVGGFPTVVYWMNCGDVDWFDKSIFAELVVIGAGYALIALAASLLHDNILMANPFTAISAIVQIGWDYVQPCISGGVALMLAAGAIERVLFGIPSMKLAVLALWGFWVFVLYEGMVILRMVGLTYHAHALELEWFRGRPRWGTPARFGRLYSNS